MPGHKTIYNENYLTAVTAYRENLTASDDTSSSSAGLEEFDFDNLPKIVIPSTLNDVDQSGVRIGASNHLFVFVIIDSAVDADVTIRLWREVDGVRYDCSPSSWVALARSSMLHDFPVAAGEYILTVSGTFIGTLHLFEQHSE